MSENVGAATSRNPKGLHGLYRDSFTFYLLDIRLGGSQTQFFDVMKRMKFRLLSIIRTLSSGP
jgi:hypothetical protein